MPPGFPDPFLLAAGAPNLVGMFNSAPGNSGLAHNIKQLVRVSLPAAAHVQFALNLDLELSGLEPSHKRFCNDASGPRKILAARIAKDSSSAWVFKVLFQFSKHTIHAFKSSWF